MLIKRYPRYPAFVEDKSQGIIPPQDTLGIESVDVDNDGDIDIVIPNQNSFGFLGAPFLDNQILINDGLGNFTEDNNRFSGVLPGTISTIKLVPGDFNNDGFVDFFSCGLSIAGFPVGLYMNDQLGYFVYQDLSSLAPTTRTGGACINAVVVDMDSDGDDDIIFHAPGQPPAGSGSPTPYGSYLLRNEGTLGTIIILTSISLNMNYIGNESIYDNLVVADVDNDGNYDIMSNGHLFMNQGGLNFIDQTQTRVPGITVGDGFLVDEPVDLDNDGDIDMVGNEDSFYINDGTGNFEKVTYRPPFTLPDYFAHLDDLCVFPTSSPLAAGAVEAADIDGDGLPDVMISLGPCLLVFKNNGINPTTGLVEFTEKTFQWEPDYQYKDQLRIRSIDFLNRYGKGTLSAVFMGSPIYAPDRLKFLDFEDGILVGDVDLDGTISILDALLVARFTVGFISLTTDQLLRADVNKDGRVDILDALLIARLAAGLPISVSIIQEYCAEIPCQY